MTDTSWGSPQFDELSGQLVKMKTSLGPSEIQGVVLGMMCGSPSTPDPQALVQLITQEIHHHGLGQGTSMSPEMEQMLVDLIKNTEKSLKQEDFSLVLFLPDQEEALEDRTHALALWCRGFLYGIGLSVREKTTLEQPEIKEAIMDIMQISHLEDEGEESLENEKALMELQEYIKVAVLLMYQELVLNLQSQYH